MSITSGGKSYNPSFPVANVNNNSKGFRDNFATIKFAIESLQTAQSGGALAGGLTSNGSILKLSASSDTTNGAVLLKAEFNPTGFRLPLNRPASPAAGMICYENGVLFFHNGSVWQTFIERVGDTVTLPNIVVTSKLSINYSPSAPTDAVNVQWVQNYIASLPSAGMDPAIYTRLDNLEEGLSDEIEARASEDARIEGLITTERARINAHDTQFTQVGQQIIQVEADLNERMDGVENLVESVSGDFTTLSQSVQAAVTQVNNLSQAVADDLANEAATRLAADQALSARIDTINNTTLPGITASVTAERDARIAADDALQQSIAATNTALNTERTERIAQGNVQNNTIAAFADTVSQSNALVLTMDGRINTVTTDLATERNNRIVGDQALTQTINNETTARQQAIAAETAARNAADAALGQRIDTEIADRTSADNALGDRIDDEAQARADAIAASEQSRDNADDALGARIDQEIADRSAADDTLSDRIDALEASSGGPNDYLDKSDGGTVSGPMVFSDDVTIQDSVFTLQNSTLELPGSDVKIDASKALLFTKLPNTTGVGDGGYVTFDENNFRYALLDNGNPSGPERSAAVALGDAANEFACLRIGSTNDPTGGAADSVAIEPSAHLFLNPGWTGQDYLESGDRIPATGSSVFVGDALDWTVQIARDDGNLYTKGSLTAAGDIQGLSDESVKDNVRQITGALDKIEALVGVMYERNDQGGKASTGLIAQNVQQVMPEVVGELENGKLTVAYGNLMGLVIEAIKELRAEVQALKK